MIQPTAKIEFDPTSPEFANDPYSVYAQLRDLEAPYYCENTGALMLARFDDVESAARNPSLVRSNEVFLSPPEIEQARREANWHDMPNHQRFIQFSLLDSDGDVHDRLRLLVMRHMSRRFVENQRAKIESYVSKLMHQLLERREIDFIEDLACHVPGHIIGSVLGVPDEDCPQLRVWSENVVQFFDIGRTQEHKDLAENATTEFYHYLIDLIALREKDPQQDLVTALIAERNSDNLNETELISTCMLILMAGHGSTIDVLGTGMYTLLKYPEELQKLRHNPALIPSAIQEMFRYESPLPFFHRYACVDIEVMGTTYPVGTKFGLLYGSANRDSKQFDAPELFTVDRNPNRHVAFGRGAHLCLGNHLSRIDMEVIFNTLLSLTSSIELVEEPQFKPGLSTRGLFELKLRLAV